MDRTVERAFERSARRWLRAYPPRWRRERADEAVALLADLTADARRVDLRTALGLVRGGWSTRRRTRPPLRTFLTFRFRGRLPGPEHAAWLEDDVTGRWFHARAALAQVLVVGLVAWGVAAVGWLSWEAVLFGSVVMVLSEAVRATRRMLRREDPRRPAVAGDVGRFGPYVRLDPPDGGTR
ncbi:hypothetical protein GXP71_13360 [Cellulomonas sp. H30R-01]|uniref:hypothetical protein n=1 Tax=Cellulomonas sp. H30R-01 TaxID=2704467 RepID=UPI00138D81DF|nr:hypothetical protein [Cellulomonas sp. H30R-01]QHT56969.1 hypothetical protein GXP71_13360 [Cellulomonas sp. H30R-01]